MSNTLINLEKIIAASNLAFCLTDKDFNLLLFSKGFKKLFNKGTQIKKGVPLFTLFVDFETIEEFEKIINSSFKNNLKITLLNKLNKEIIQATCEKNIEQKLVFYNFIFYTTKGEKFSSSPQMILDAIPLPLFFENEKGDIINCNMQFEKLVQMPRDTILNNKKRNKRIKLITKEDTSKINALSVIEEDKEIVFDKNSKKIFKLTKSPFLTENMEFGGIVGILNDVTKERDTVEKLKISEFKIKEAEELFRSLWENSLDGFRLVDTKGEIILVNKSYCELVNKREEELIGKIFTTVYSEDLINIIGKFHQRLKNKNIKEHSEDYVTFWDGKKVWLESLNKLITIKNKNYVLTIFRDVTNRHKIEEQLKNLLTFESLVSKLNSNYLISKADNVNNVINENLTNVGKYLTADFIGLYYKVGDKNELLYSWFSENKNRNNSYLINNSITANLKINKLLSENKVIILDKNNVQVLNEYRILINDFINYNINFIILLPLIINNKLKGYIGIECNERKIETLNLNEENYLNIRDSFINILVREENYKLLKHEKEELKVILENIIDGVIVVNKNEIIIHYNEASLKILNLENELIKGKNLRYIISKLMNNLTGEEKQEAVKFYQFITSYKKGNETFKLTLNNNNTRIIQVNISDITNEKGEVDGYIYILWDLTEKINTEKKVAFSQKMEAIGQLSAGIAHEINTPMQYINDNNKFLNESLNLFYKFINELQDKSNNPKVKNLKEQVKRLIEENDIIFYLNEGLNAVSQSKVGIERVISIIKAMKDFSHPGQKSKILTDINNNIEVTSLISRNAWKYFAEMNLNLDKNLPQIFCKPQEINQVLLNMIINAAQAIEEAINKKLINKGIIEITTSKQNDCIIITIKDNGIGIKKEHVGKIFDMFFTTKEVGKGTGQGLSISYDIIVNRHQGKIEVESQYKKGTIFRISLPINL